jgi:hypothetical protein
MHYSMLFQRIAGSVHPPRFAAMFRTCFGYYLCILFLLHGFTYTRVLPLTGNRTFSPTSHTTVSSLYSLLAARLGISHILGLSSG